MRANPRHLHYTCDAVSIKHDGGYSPIHLIPHLLCLLDMALELLAPLKAMVDAEACLLNRRRHVVHDI